MTDRDVDAVVAKTGFFEESGPPGGVVGGERGGEIPFWRSDWRSIEAFAQASENERKRKR